jgi:hypothetical protein
MKTYITESTKTKVSIILDERNNIIEISFFRKNVNYYKIRLSYSNLNEKYLYNINTFIGDTITIEADCEDAITIESISD